MEEINFVLLWKEHYEKIDRSLAINKQLLKEVINQKAESTIRSLIRGKSAGIIIAVIYLIILGAVLFYAIAHYSSAANYFIGSMSCIFLINIKALYDYIKHLVWADRLSYSGSVAEIQDKLTRLQLSILHHSRIMVLQFPFWTTFYLSDAWFPHAAGWSYIAFQVLLTGSFAYLAYWLYKNQTLANADKKWIRVFLAGAGGRKVMKALEFYKEIENLERE